jgi:hypothetical protein
MLWLRPLRGTDQPQPGTGGARAPFWSPDSRSIGFFSGTRMLRLDLASGTVRQICEGCATEAVQPAAWSTNDVIVFRGALNAGLSRVDAEGGQAIRLTRLDSSKAETDHSSPWFLPDNRHFLFIASGTNFSTLYVGDLDGTRSKPLMRDLAAVAFAHGHVLFVRATNLLAQPLDLTTLQLTGKVVSIRSNVLNGGTDANGAAFSVSQSAELVFQSGYASGPSRLVLKNRRGETVRTVTAIGDYADLLLSHDGRQATVSVGADGNGGRDITIIDLDTGRPRRLTTDPDDEYEGVWSWTGDDVFYNIKRGLSLNIFRRRADGSDTPTLVRSSAIQKFPQGVSPDGRYLMYMTIGIQGQDLWRLDLQTQEVTPWMITDTSDGGGQYSSDGRWVTYYSQGHVWIRPADGPGGPWQVSNERGGSFPRWRRDGTEIFYVSAGTLMVAPVNCRGDACEVRDSRTLFDVRFGGRGRWSYDVTPDGQQFLVIEAEPSMQGPMELLLNWHTLLAPASP